MFRRKKTKAVDWNEVLEFEKSRKAKGPELEELFPTAVEVILSNDIPTGPSVPLLQKKMKLSYSTAARLMDMLEELRQDYDLSILIRPRYHKPSFVFTQIFQLGNSFCLFHCFHSLSLWCDICRRGLAVLLQNPHMG